MRHVHVQDAKLVGRRGGHCPCVARLPAGYVGVAVGRGPYRVGDMDVKWGLYFIGGRSDVNVITCLKQCRRFGQCFERGGGCSSCVGIGTGGAADVEVVGSGCVQCQQCQGYDHDFSLSLERMFAKTEL